MVCCVVGCCPTIPDRKIDLGTSAAIPVKKETAECRLCYEHGDAKKLIAPCKCSGHMKYVHRDCLDVWRAHNQHCEHFFRCDICGLPYVLEQHCPEAPGQDTGVSPKTKYGCLVFGDVMAAIGALQALILLTSFIILWFRTGSFMKAGKTYFDGFGECCGGGLYQFWRRYGMACIFLLINFGLFSVVMQCINCCCPRCFTDTCWRGELMSQFWWSCGCCNTPDHQADNREDNYTHREYVGHTNSGGGCCSGPCNCICYGGGGDCNCSGGGGNDGEAFVAILVIIAIILIVIALIQLVIVSVIIIQLIVRRHIHVLEKRHLAAIWRVRDRDGEDLSNQVVHVEWYNITPPPQGCSGVGPAPSPSAPPAPCAVDAAVPSIPLAPIPEVNEVHFQVGPTPPEGYDTLVHRVKGLGW